MPGADSSPALPRDYDMIDSPGTAEFSYPMDRAIEVFARTVNEIYGRFDKAALRHQRFHRILTNIAVACGTIAVFLAIIQLSDLSPSEWPLWIEVVAAVLASVAVVLGLTQARHPRWLTERHKSELCRFLKFRSLLDPDLWGGDPGKIDEWENRVVRDSEAIQELDRQALNKWEQDPGTAELLAEMGRMHGSEVTKDVL